MSAIREPHPKHNGEAIKSNCKDKRIVAVNEELKALKGNGAWVVVVPPKVLYKKWVFKTKMDANGDMERYKARPMACDNEQLFGVDYTLAFAAVMELSTVKVILVRSRR